MVLTRAQNQPGPDGMLGTARRHPGRAATPTRRGSTRARPTPRTRRTRCSCASTCRHRDARLDNAAAVSDRQAARRAAGRPDLPGSAGRHRRHRPPGHRSRSRRTTCSACSSSTQDVLEHPDARDRPVRQVHPRPARAAAVRDRPDRHSVEGNLASPGAGRRPNVAALRHAVPDRHRAQRRPVGAGHRQRRIPTRVPTPDADSTIQPTSPQQPPGTYDDELLDAHFTCGDGRCNENIALSHDPPGLPLRARPPRRRHQEHPRHGHVTDRRRGAGGLEGHWRPGRERHRRLRLR